MNTEKLFDWGVGIVALVLLALLVFALAAPARADTHGVVTAYAGAQGAWWANADPYQGDCELTGNLSASLSPNISVVGGGAWGICNSYLRGAAGLRVTATDVNDPNFSVGVGCQYRFGSKAAMRPGEWAPDVSVGFRPVPNEMPALLLVAQGWYGLETQRVGATIGARWRFPL